MAVKLGKMPVTKKAQTCPWNFAKCSWQNLEKTCLLNKKVQVKSLENHAVKKRKYPLQIFFLILKTQKKIASSEGSTLSTMKVLKSTLLKCWNLSRYFNIREITKIAPPPSQPRISARLPLPPTHTHTIHQPLPSISPSPHLSISGVPAPFFPDFSCTFHHQNPFFSLKVGVWGLPLFSLEFGGFRQQKQHQNLRLTPFSHQFSTENSQICQNLNSPEFQFFLLYRVFFSIPYP